MIAGKGASEAIEVSSAGRTGCAGRPGEAIGVPGIETSGGDEGLDRWRCTIGSPHWATTPDRPSWPLGPARAWGVVVMPVGCDEDVPGFDWSVPPASPVRSGRRWTLDAARGALRTAGNDVEAVLAVPARPIDNPPLVVVDDWPDTGAAMELPVWSIGTLLLMVAGDWPDTGAAMALVAWTVGTLLLMVADDWPDTGAAMELPIWTIGMLLLMVADDRSDAGAALEVFARPIGDLVIMVAGDLPDANAVLETLARTIGMPFMSIGAWPDAGDGFLAIDDGAIGAGRREAGISFDRTIEGCVAAEEREPFIVGSDPGPTEEVSMLATTSIAFVAVAFVAMKGCSSGAEAATTGDEALRTGNTPCSAPAAVERVTPTGALCTVGDCANRLAASGWTAAPGSCIALTTGNEALVAHASRPPQEGRSPGVPTGSEGTAACGSRYRYNSCGQPPHEPPTEGPQRRWIASSIGSRPLASRATRSGKCRVTFSGITPGPGSTRW